MDLAKALNLDAVSRFNSELNGEKFWFDAKEEMLTPEFLENLDNWDTDQKGCCELVATVIVAWDVQMNGEDFPPTYENLRKTPKKFLTHCVNVISESWSGNPPTPSESAST